MSTSAVVPARGRARPRLRPTRREALAAVAGVLVPLAVCAVLSPFRESLANTDAALILVVAVVAVAGYGRRLAGVLASVFGAAWFDLFLTVPYERFAIAGRQDVETFLLLLVVGLAVTELAVRGRRHRLLAQTDEAYLDAIRSTEALAASGAGRAALVEHVCTQLRALLGLRECTFQSTRFGGLIRLDADGQLRDGDRVWDVEQRGLPDRDIEILAASGSRMGGRFVLRPTPGDLPTVAARKCAVIVVSQAAAVLADERR